MKNEYYIIGSSGFAKEVLFLAKETLIDNYKFKGFIDYKPKSNKIIALNEEFDIIDEDFFLNTVIPDKNISVYIGIGDPETISKVSNKFKSYMMPNLIHPTVVIHKDSVALGIGNIITSGCIFTVDIKIGNFNIFNLNSTVGHDTLIGDYNVINPGANISGLVIIGSKNLLGTNCTILDERTIGSNNVIGASSLVNKNVDDNNIMVGVPAKPLNKN
jgi:sugar O-acyltransferase (sialic acid O-acetyltransferase NeuD family)